MCPVVECKGLPYFEAAHIPRSPSRILAYLSDPSASGAQFVRFTLLVVLLAYCGQGIGLVVSCGIASRMLAMVVTPLAIAPFILFTPYAVDIDSLPGYFIPFQVGSPFWVRAEQGAERSSASWVWEPDSESVRSLIGGDI
jgi:hypothetical protein